MVTKKTKMLVDQMFKSIFKTLNMDNSEIIFNQIKTTKRIFKKI